MKLPCFVCPLFLSALTMPGFAQQTAAPERDLVLARWEAGRWALYPGRTIQPLGEKTPTTGR